MDRLWIKGSSLETVHSLKKKKSAVPTLRHLNLPADICLSKRYYERRSLSLQAMYVSLIIDTARYIQVMKSGVWVMVVMVQWRNALDYEMNVASL